MAIYGSGNITRRTMWLTALTPDPVQLIANGDADHEVIPHQPVTTGSTTLTLQPSASNQDAITQYAGVAQTRGSSGSDTVTLTGGDPGVAGGIYLGWASAGVATIGVYFSGVTIPQGTTLTSATFTLVSHDTYTVATAGKHVWGNISTEAHDNPSAFTTAAGNLNTTNRPRSTAFKADASYDVATANVGISIDITAAVQERINSAGWASGNAIVVLVDLDVPNGVSGEWQTFYSWDFAGVTAAQLPKLEIIYTAAGGGATPITDADTGAGAEGVTLVTIVASETGSGTEAVAGIALASTDTASTAEGAGITLSGVSDAASGAEAASVTPTFFAADTGTGVEAVAGVTISGVGETGSGVEGVSIFASVLAADSGTGSDAVGSIALSGIAESGTGSDAPASIALSPAGDTGTGTEAASSIGVAAAETGTGTQAVVGIALARADSGTGTEAVGIALASGDTASGSEAAGIALAASDTGSGAEAVISKTLSGVGDNGAGSEATPQIALSGVGDSGTSSETATLNGQTTVTAADTGSGVDAVASLALGNGETGSGTETAGVALAAAESGVGSDAAQSIALTGSDTGSGAEGQSSTLAAADGGTGSEAVAGIWLFASDVAFTIDGVLVVILDAQETGHGVDAGTGGAVGAAVPRRVGITTAAFARISITSAAHDRITVTTAAAQQIALTTAAHDALALTTAAHALVGITTEG
jgi:hypothetical protein